MFDEIFYYGAKDNLCYVVVVVVVVADDDDYYIYFPPAGPGSGSSGSTSECHWAIGRRGDANMSILK